MLNLRTALGERDPAAGDRAGRPPAAGHPPDAAVEPRRGRRVGRGDAPGPPGGGGGAPAPRPGGRGRLPGVPGAPAAAADAYRGPFLDAFAGPPSDLFEEWAALKREWLRRRVAGALEQLAEAHLAAGRAGGGAGYARRELALEPLAEGAHRRLMRALAAGGDRGPPWPSTRPAGASWRRSWAPSRRRRRRPWPRASAPGPGPAGPRPPRRRRRRRARPAPARPPRRGGPARALGRWDGGAAARRRRAPRALGWCPGPRRRRPGAQLARAPDGARRAGAGAGGGRRAPGRDAPGDPHRPRRGGQDPPGPGGGRALAAAGRAPEAGDAPARRTAAASGGPDGAPYPDGVWLVELAALADPALVPQAVAAAVGVREAPGRALLDTLVPALRAAAPAAGAGQLRAPAGRLRARWPAPCWGPCPGLRVLATSRRAAGPGRRGHLVGAPPGLARRPAGGALPPAALPAPVASCGLRGGAPVRRAGPGVAPRLRPDARQRRGRGRGLRPPGRPAPGPGAGGARWRCCPRPSWRPAWTTLPPADRGQPGGPAPAADPGGRPGLGPRPAGRAGAGASSGAWRSSPGASTWRRPRPWAATDDGRAGERRPRRG